MELSDKQLRIVEDAAHDYNCAITKCDSAELYKTFIGRVLQHIVEVVEILKPPASKNNMETISDLFIESDLLIETIFRRREEDDKYPRTRSTLSDVWDAVKNVRDIMRDVHHRINEIDMLLETEGNEARIKELVASTTSEMLRCHKHIEIYSGMASRWCDQCREASNELDDSNREKLKPLGDKAEELFKTMTTNPLFKAREACKKFYDTVAKSVLVPAKDKEPSQKFIEFITKYKQLPDGTLLSSEKINQYIQLRNRFIHNRDVARSQGPLTMSGSELGQLQKVFKRSEVIVAHLKGTNTSQTHYPDGGLFDPSLFTEKDLVSITTGRLSQDLCDRIKR